MIIRLISFPNPVIRVGGAIHVSCGLVNLVVDSGGPSRNTIERSFWGYLKRNLTIGVAHGLLRNI